MDMQVQDLTPETEAKPVDPMAQMFSTLVDSLATAVLRELLGNPKHYEALQQVTRDVIDGEVQEVVNKKFSEYDLNDSWDDISDSVDSAISDWVSNNFDITDHFDIDDYKDAIQEMCNLGEADIADALKGCDFTITFS